MVFRESCSIPDRKTMRELYKRVYGKPKEPKENIIRRTIKFTNQMLQSIKFK
ncbi:hypothetical protein KO317_03385 [Candidatus Micrarchaeota archaeon]|jgi:hypothetical protein|nr:hypothetical protein [Candidatus Micrarchaeota archaeon]